MAGAAGIGMGAVSAVNTYKDFEYQMATVKALATANMDSKEAEETMARITAKSKELGATTQFTAKEVGQAFEYMALAGWKSEAMLQSIPAVLNLSAAAGEDLARVSDIVTDSMTGMHIEATAENAQHFADVMAAMVTNSNTTVGMAGEAFKYAAPIAGSLGYSIDDVALMTGLMANAGIKGSQAGTSMRSTFTRMATDQQTAALAKNMLGVSTTNEDGSMRGLRDVLLDLRGKFNEGIDNDKLVDFIAHASDIKNVRNKDKIVDMMKQMKENGGKMSESDKVKFANMLAGQEAMSGLLAAITASDEDFNKLTNAIDNSAGAAEKMAKIKMDTLEGDVKTLASAWEGLQLTLMEGAPAEGMRSFVQTVSEEISKLNSLFQDGVDIGDFGTIILDVVSKLKNKFLEFDGIGSILAGGVLAGALVKITQKVVGLMDKIQSLKNLASGLGGTGGNGNGSGGAGNGNHGAGNNGISSVTKVGTMNVTASVVNLNSKTGGTGSGGAGHGGHGGSNNGHGSGNNGNNGHGPHGGNGGGGNPPGNPPPSGGSRFGKMLKVGGAIVTAAEIGLSAYDAYSVNQEYEGKFVEHEEKAKQRDEDFAKVSKKYESGEITQDEYSQAQQEYTAETKTSAEEKKQLEHESMNDVG